MKHVNHQSYANLELIIREISKFFFPPDHRVFIISWVFAYNPKTFVLFVFFIISFSSYGEATENLFCESIVEGSGMLQKLSYSWRCPGPRQRSQVLLMKNRDNLTRLKRNKNWMHAQLHKSYFEIFLNINVLRSPLYVLRVHKRQSQENTRSLKEILNSYLLRPALYCSLCWDPNLTSGSIILYSYW